MNYRIFLFGGSAILLVIIAIIAILMNASGARMEDTHVSTDAPPATTSEPETQSTGNIDQVTEQPFELISPTRDTVIKSPLQLMGRARGTWFFEASFPIELQNADGQIIATTHGTASTDWMTEDFVDWTATLTWGATSTTATSGVLVFKKDNPSGLAEHDASVEIPVLLQ